MAAPDFRRTLRTQLRRLNNAPPQDSIDGGGGCVIQFSPANLNNNNSNNNNISPPTLAVVRPEALKIRSKSSSRHTSNDCDEELAGIICNSMSKNAKAKRRGSLFFLGTDEEDESRESSPTQMSVDSGHGASLKSASVSPIPPRSNSNTSTTSATTLALKQSQQRKKLTAGLFQTAPTPNPTTMLSSTPTKLTSNSSSSQLDRMRSYNRNVRRAKSFRGSMRERSLSGSGRYIRKEVKIDNNQNETKKEATFKVSRSKFGRKGWKVMPEEDNLDLKESAGAIEKVMARIKDLEFSGKQIPDTITVEWG